MFSFLLMYLSSWSTPYLSLFLVYRSFLLRTFTSVSVPFCLLIPLPPEMFFFPSYSTVLPCPVFGQRIIIFPNDLQRFKMVFKRFSGASGGAIDVHVRLGWNGWQNLALQREKRRIRDKSSYYFCIICAEGKRGWCSEYWTKTTKVARYSRGQYHYDENCRTS